MVDIQLLSKEDILKFTEPEQLFDKDEFIAQYKKLAMKWHPDHNPDKKVFPHIQELFGLAKQKIAQNKWETPFQLSIPLKDGKRFEQKYMKAHEFELGKLYITPTSIVYVVENAHKNLVNNFVKFNPQFSSEKMKEHMSRFIPIQTKTFISENKFIVAVPRHKETILLADCPKLDQKHVAWIISRLYDITCYLAYNKISHNGIDINSCYIYPEKHAVYLLGGWWYQRPFKEKLLAIPSKVYDNLPAKHKVIAGDIRIDLNSIKTIGRELLGDISGTKLVHDKSLAEPLVTWLNTPSLKTTAIEDYRKWEKVLKDSFGERKFIKLELYAKDVYKEI